MLLEQSKARHNLWGMRPKCWNNICWRQTNCYETSDFSVSGKIIAHACKLKMKEILLQDNNIWDLQECQVYWDLIVRRFKKGQNMQKKKLMFEGRFGKIYRPKDERPECVGCYANFIENERICKDRGKIYNLLHPTISFH